MRGNDAYNSANVSVISGRRTLARVRNLRFEGKDNIPVFNQSLEKMVEYMTPFFFDKEFRQEDDDLFRDALEHLNAADVLGGEVSAEKSILKNANLTVSTYDSIRYINRRLKETSSPNETDLASRVVLLALLRKNVQNLSDEAMKIYQDAMQEFCDFSEIATNDETAVLRHIFDKKIRIITVKKYPREYVIDLKGLLLKPEPTGNIKARGDNAGILASSGKEVKKARFEIQEIISENEKAVEHVKQQENIIALLERLNQAKSCDAQMMEELYSLSFRLNPFTISDVDKSALKESKDEAIRHLKGIKKNLKESPDAYGLVFSKKRALQSLEKIDNNVRAEFRREKNSGCLVM